MPPTGPLEAGEIGVLRAWIDQGAEFGDVAFEVAEPRKPVDPKVRELIQAVRKHDTVSVKALLKSAPEHVNGLDGGGSTTMVVRREVVNRTSDQTGERAVANALLVVASG